MRLQKEPPAFGSWFYFSAEIQWLSATLFIRTKVVRALAVALRSDPSHHLRDGIPGTAVQPPERPISLDLIEEPLLQQIPIIPTPRLQDAGAA